MIGSDDWYDGSTDTGSDDWYDGSTDTGSDDEPVVPTSDLTVLISGQNVVFNGTGDGTETIFVLNSNILTNPAIVKNCSYIYTEDSKIDTTGVSILPKFVIEDNDETVIDIVDSFNLSDYPSDVIVKAVYVYKINTYVSLYLKPEVHVDLNTTNAVYSQTITDQIKNAKEDADEMTGATDTVDGKKGTVPAPKAGDNHKFFKGDGSYSKVNLAEEVTDILSVENGGTGASNSDEALLNLNAVRDDIITTNKETTDISSRSYAIGDQFIFDNVLYTVTQTIATGDQLIVGTNIKNSESLVKQIKEISVVGTTFVGATDTSDGEMGLVPTPLAGDQDKVLKGDGSWGYITNNFVGTLREWEALTLAEKIKYETADILPEYKVTVVEDSHVDSVVLDPASVDGYYGYGRVVNVTAEPETGYEITGGTGAYVITENTTINVVTDIEHLRLTVTGDSHVHSITLNPEPDEDGCYDYGTVVTVSAIFDEHYIAASGTGQYTITKATSVEIKSMLEQFTVTINADNGIDNVRLIPASTNNVYDYGTTILAVVTPITGYNVVSGSGEYTVTSNMTISAVSEIQHWSLTVNGDEHITSYTLSPESTREDGKYDYGTVVTISATFDEHYEAESGTGPIVIRDDTIVEIVSRLEQFALRAISDEHISLVTFDPEPDSSTGKYDYGTVVTVSAVAETGYDVIAGTGEYTVTEDTTINITSEIKHFTLTVTHDANVASVSLSPESTRSDGKYDYGTVVTVSAIPATGYDILSGTGDYTITANTDISVLSALQVKTIIFTADGNITQVVVDEVDPDGIETHIVLDTLPYSMNSKYGSVLSISATAETGYDVISGTGEYAIASDTTIDVVSEIKHLIVIVNGDVNVDSVTVTPESTRSDGKYDYGTVVTVSAIPATGYDILSGTGDYTITEDTTINVTSEIKHFALNVITDEHVANYTLSPESTREDGKYDYGMTVVAMAIAESGYQFNTTETSKSISTEITTDTSVEFETELAPMRFTNNDGESTVTLSVTSPGWDGIMEYSVDDQETWTEWDGNALTNTDIYLRGSSNTTLYNGQYDNRFIFTGQYAIGSVETLLDYDTAVSGTHPTMATGAFHSMFAGCAALVAAPILPATTLSEDCYYSMFAGCATLVAAPILPATVMAAYCYAYMFDSCTSLTTPPALSAATLAEGCYDSMFVNCTSLNRLPVLPALTLAEDCYEEMFLNCSSIKLSSILTAEYAYAYRIPATGTGVNTSSMRRMFYNTGGTFKDTPSINTTYYTNNEAVS